MTLSEDNDRLERESNESMYYWDVKAYDMLRLGVYCILGKVLWWIGRMGEDDDETTRNRMG